MVLNSSIVFLEEKMGRFLSLFSKIKSSSGFLFVLILVFIYFSFYAVKGERGLIRYINLNKEVEQAREMSEKYLNEKNMWNDKVKRLSSENLDLDMLDEQARLVLNMVGPKEFVILDSQEN